MELCGYSPGVRATFDVRAGGQRFALKVYAKDPSLEVELHKALEEAGLAGDSGPRAPRLLAWEPGLRMFAISWLDGYPANELIKVGRARRAGLLAARWLRRLASRSPKLGPALGPSHVLARCAQSVENLRAADFALGVASEKVLSTLRSAEPENGRPSLVHGSLYSRHVLDLGDGPGVIDWQRFGQGPVELDAGMFLATVSRSALRHAKWAKPMAQAERAFLRRVRPLVDGRAVAWHWAEALLHLASRGLRRARIAEAYPLVREADSWARFATGEKGPRDRFGRPWRWLDD
jgi:aminoglycoside phosphotransferase (APT) family kinase protein